MVRRVQPGLFQEREQLILMVPDVLAQPLVPRVHLVAFRQFHHLLLEFHARPRRRRGFDLARVAPVTDRQRFHQQRPDPPRHHRRGSAVSLAQFQQRLAPTQQVIQTRLVARLLESVVRGPAVVHQVARVVFVDELHRRFIATQSVNQIRRRVDPHHRVHPRRLPADPPAGLIGHEPGRTLKMFDNLITLPLRPPCRPQHGLADAAGREGDLEDMAEEPRDFAVREAQTLVHDRCRGLRVWPQLTDAAAQRIGSLQGVPALHAGVAAGALPDGDVELAVDRPVWQLGLILMVDPGGRDRPAAAVWAPGGQRRVVDLVDLNGVGDGTEGLLAVVVAGLAAGRLGIDLGRAFGKGRRLSFVAAVAVGKEPFEFFEA